MDRWNKYFAFIIMLILTPVLSCTYANDNVSQLSPSQLNNASSNKIDFFKSALIKNGFEVQEGSIVHLDPIEMYNYGGGSDCGGNNPSSPYMVYALPPAPGMMADRPGIHLRQDEAIVYVGKTPPSCKYFSYQTYLMQRYLPETDMHKVLCASLGNSINNLTIKTDGTNNDPFDKNTIIVTTANRITDEHVRNAALVAGYPSNIINTDIFPSEITRMGLESNTDTFWWMMRMAFFKDEIAGRSFIDNPPALLLRLTPIKQIQFDSFPTPILRTRGTGSTEVDLTNSLNDLRKAIIEKYPNLIAKELSIQRGDIKGYEAIKQGVYVGCDQQDTIYLSSESFALDDNPNDFTVVYGVNHAATGKATYSSFAIYGTKAWNGVAAIDNERFVGTAEKYIPGNPEAKYLYAWKVARHCDNVTDCLEVPYGPKASGIEINQLAFIMYRSYLEAATKAGPSYFEIIPDCAIKFSAKPTESTERVGDKKLYINEDLGFHLAYPSYWVDDPSKGPSDVLKVKDSSGVPLLSVAAWRAYQGSSIDEYVNSTVAGWGKIGAENIRIVSKKGTLLDDHQTFAYEVVLDFTLKGSNLISLQLAVFKDSNWISIQAIDWKYYYPTHESLLRDTIYSLRFQ